VIFNKAISIKVVRGGVVVTVMPIDDEGFLENEESRRRMRKKAISLSSSISSMLGSTDEMKRSLVLGQLKEAWEVVAPQNILDHTGSLFIKNVGGQRICVVLVDNSMLAADLATRSLYFLVMMNKRLAESNSVVQPFDRLEFKVSYKVGKRQLFTKKVAERPSYLEPTRPLPLSDDEMKTVRKSIDNLPTEKLREAARNAMIANMEWKKGIKADKTP
jgi:hypothetical protein